MGASLSYSGIDFSCDHFELGESFHQALATYGHNPNMMCIP